MKKIISILLVFATLAGIASISVTAEETADYSVYPESEHDYQNNCFYEEWFYSHPEETDGLFVTFSEDTYFEPWSDDKEGDSIEIYTAYEEEDGEIFKDYHIGYFSGDELASRTIYIPSSSFTISLITDSSVTAYGFKIDSISTVMPENADVICYNFKPNMLNIEKYYVFYNEGETVTVADNLPDFFMYEHSRFSEGNKYRCGWTTEPDGKLVYDDGAEITPEGGIVNLYAAYTPILVSANEVFNFQNSAGVFNLGNFDEGAQSYYMTDEHHEMLLRNAFRLGIPGLLFYKELKNYPYRGFEGSCFGMACSVFLNYYGMIDLLSLQEGAETVKELEPSAEVVSTVNYYQALTLLIYLCTNQGYGVGSDGYKEQLKALYDTAASGKPVLLSILTDERFIFGTSHSMLVTGAYTDTKGNHYLLVYEGQRYYAESEITVIPIAPDFSSLSSKHGNAFYWTDENSFIEAFDINGETSPAKWYLEFAQHISELLKMLLRYWSVPIFN